MPFGAPINNTVADTHYMINNQVRVLLMDTKFLHAFCTQHIWVLVKD